jgi:Ca2+-binding EF-hand superfamily protein
MMQNMMKMMMPMMMQMHSKMMDGGAGKMNGRGMAMMDRDMMQMMMGPGMMADPSEKDASGMMQKRMAEFDADGDGSLSLAEFEALHAAMIRETAVDRFQHLDADGDGRVTEAEMGAPAQRMNMRRMKHNPSQQGSDN